MVKGLRSSANCLIKRYLIRHLIRELNKALTHPLINLHISAMAYYINTLDGERSVHGRYEPKCFKVGDLF